MLYPTSKNKDLALDNSYLSELSLEAKTLEANGIKLYYVRGEGAAGMP